jgi:murein DD-endopeptidase MepM/ murein hydrolase activator NlpD
MPRFSLTWPGRRLTAEPKQPRFTRLLEFREFISCLASYLHKRFYRWFNGFELVKGLAVDRMYRQRGKYAGVFIHLGVVSLGFFGLTLGPSLVAGADENETKISSAFHQLGTGVGGSDLGQVLGESSGTSPVTIESDKPRAEIAVYEVQDGDTLSTIAEKFGVNIDSIRWANSSITSINSIKPGDQLNIPPVSGIVHTVKSGETIYSIAKKYEADAQSIVDFPFNTFTNDETFALAIGQQVVVPDGVMPTVQQWSPGSNLARRLTPDAGAVSATGTWIWPAAGSISQPWRSWHQAIDIANRGGGNILAADSGKVIVSGWPDNWGYGNRIVIDHGNGYQTLYAHLSRLSVVVNQTVKRGDVIGQMGSTGRSTGTHLHFEIRLGGRGLNPLEFLQ